MWVKYSHEPWNVSLPMQTGYKVTAEAAPPAAYIIPAQWTDVIGVLAAHQVEMKRTTKAWTGEVETYQCAGMVWQEPPFEGRHPTFNGETTHDPGKFGSCVLIRQKMSFPAGSAVVRLNQRLSKVVMEWLNRLHLTRRCSGDSSDSIFEQKEYGEAYVLESLAREMMAKDPKLKEEFERKISSDPAFAGDPRARLEFFYERSPWFAANRIGLYPVGRLDDVQQLGELK